MCRYKAIMMMTMIKITTLITVRTSTAIEQELALRISAVTQDKSHPDLLLNNEALSFLRKRSPQEEEEEVE